MVQMSTVATSRKLDWKQCVVCQTKSSEELQCPTRSDLDVKRPPIDIYATFLNNSRGIPEA